jgi:hypothetical protein
MSNDGTPMTCDALEGPTFAADPHAQPPRCFLEVAYVDDLVQDFQAAHGLPPAEEVAAAAGAAAAGHAAAGPAAGGSRSGSEGQAPPPVAEVLMGPR